MKKNFIINSIAFIALFGSSFIQKTVEQCNIRDLRKVSKSALDPYHYDSQLLKKITLTQSEVTHEIATPLSTFGKFRMLFNCAGMPVKIPISVYDKDHYSKKRKLLWNNEKISETEKILVYEPPDRTREIFIDIDVPADSLNKKINGCIYMMLGYK